MPPYNRGHWLEDEHQRFLDGLKRYPSGPWTAISMIVGTRSPRQVQTHAQKYFEKIERHVRGLHREPRPPPDATPAQLASGTISRGHEVDNDILFACRVALAHGHQLPTPTRLRNEEEQARQVLRSHEEKMADEVSADEDSADLSDDPEALLPLDRSLDFLIELLSQEQQEW